MKAASFMDPPMSYSGLILGWEFGDIMPEERKRVRDFTAKPGFPARGAIPQWPYSTLRNWGRRSAVPPMARARLSLAMLCAKTPLM